MSEKLIHSYQTGLEASGCHPGADWYRLVIKLDEDISEVLPYLNVELYPPTDYRHEQKCLLWKNKDKIYAFRPDEISIATVSDNDEAGRLTESTIETVNSIWKRRNGITPSIEGKKTCSPGIGTIETPAEVELQEMRVLDMHGFCSRIENRFYEIIVMSLHYRTRSGQLLAEVLIRTSVIVVVIPFVMTCVIVLMQRHFCFIVMIMAGYITGMTPPCPCEKNALPQNGSSRVTLIIVF